MAPLAVDRLVALLDESYDRRSWDRPTFRNSLRGVGPEPARKECFALLDELRPPVTALDVRDFPRRLGRGRDTSGSLARGATAHDLHHAGQIRLNRRLHES